MLELARASGWLAAHFGNSVKIVRGRDGAIKTVPDRDAAGFPDLVAVRGRRLVFAELKRRGRKPTSAQFQWLYDLKRVPVAEVYVWRPADWDEIVRTFA